jgi:hypothetical protein
MVSPESAMSQVRKWRVPEYNEPGERGGSLTGPRPLISAPECTRMLELAKAVSFLVCILSLYWAGISAFFVPGTEWQERLWIAAFKLVAAAAVCFYSGMVFSWPSRTNPTAFQRLTATLPVRLFFWAVAGISVLFTLSWYVADSEAQALSMRGF